MDSGGTVDGRTRRDSHLTSVILDITKRKVKGTHGRGGTVKWMAAGRWKGWWRDGGKDGGGTVPRRDNLKW